MYSLSLYRQAIQEYFEQEIDIFFNILFMILQSLTVVDHGSVWVLYAGTSRHVLYLMVR